MRVLRLWLLGQLKLQSKHPLLLKCRNMAEASPGVAEDQVSRRAAQEIHLEETGSCHEIIPGLWLGSNVAFMDGTTRRALVEARGLARVIRIIQPGFPMGQHKEAVAISQNESIALTVLDVEDAECSSIDKIFPTALPLIEEVLGKSPKAEPTEGEVRPSSCVLVHCMAGVSRSASVVIAFLIASQGWSLDEAMSFVKSKRKNISPNVGFAEQLANFESKRLERKSEFNIGLYDRMQMRFPHFTNRQMREFLALPDCDGDEQKLFDYMQRESARLQKEKVIPVMKVPVKT